MPGGAFGGLLLLLIAVGLAVEGEGGEGLPPRSCASVFEAALRKVGEGPAFAALCGAGRGRGRVEASALPLALAALKGWGKGRPAIAAMAGCAACSVMAARVRWGCHTPS